MFRLERRTPDGQRLRDHLEAVAQATGITPPELIPLPLPRGCQALWSAFLDLHARRGHSGFGPLPIGLGDLVAWQTLMAIDLNPWEIDTVLQLDGCVLAALTLDDEKTS